MSERIVEQQLLAIPCLRYEENNGWRDFSDVISPEEAVSLSWPGKERTLWAFPKDLDLLAMGHALLEWCAPGERPVLVSRDDRAFSLKPAQAVPLPEPTSFPAMDGETLLAGMKDFLDAQGRWDDTGCFHRMAVFHRPTGAFLLRVEDIGRHNCIDRVSGWCLLNEVNPRECALFISARATASLMAKIIASRFPLVISRSAVTATAIAMARENRVTLVGFTRIERFTLFTDEHHHVAFPETVGGRP